MGKRRGVGKWERQHREGGRFWWGNKGRWGSRKGNMGKGKVINDMVSWRPQKMLWGPQKNDYNAIKTCRTIFFY